MVICFVYLFYFFHIFEHRLFSFCFQGVTHKQDFKKKQEHNRNIRLLSVAFGLGLLNKQWMHSGVFWSSKQVWIEWQTPVLARGGGGVVGGVFPLEHYKISKPLSATFSDLGTKIEWKERVFHERRKGFQVSIFSHTITYNPWTNDDN